MPYTNYQGDYASSKGTCSAKTCLHSSREIKNGERIFHSDKTKKDMHEVCAAHQFDQKPNKKTEATKDPAIAVNSRLDAAYKIVSGQSGIPRNQINADSILLVEVMRQLQSEEWLEIERKKMG